MKLRGVLNEEVAIKEFVSMVNMISKLAKDVVMRFTAEEVWLIVCDEDQGPSRPCVWCVLPVSYFFREYLLQGVSEDCNEIYLDFPSAHFARALKQQPRVVKLKLTNKNSPCLTIEMEYQGELSSQCVQDIPVKVVPAKFWRSYDQIDEQNCDFNAIVELAHLRLLRNPIERMKTFSNHVTVAVTSQKRMTLNVEAELGHVTLHISDLKVLKYNGDSAENSDSSVSCRVDIKKLHSFLNTEQICYSKVECGIVQGKMVMFHLSQPSVFDVKCYLMGLNEEA